MIQSTSYPIMEITTSANLQILAGVVVNKWFDKADALDEYCCYQESLDKEIKKLASDSRSTCKQLKNYLTAISKDSEYNWKVYCSWDPAFKEIQGIVVQTFDKYDANNSTLAYALANPDNLPIKNPKKNMTGSVAVLFKQILTESQEMNQSIHAEVNQFLKPKITRFSDIACVKEDSFSLSFKIPSEKISHIVDSIPFEFCKKEEIDLGSKLFLSQINLVKSSKPKMVYLPKPIILTSLQDNPGFKELHFSEELITVLATKHMGLRHVTGKKVWEKEKSDGFFNGCSLSLSAQYAQFSSLNNKKWKNLSQEERKTFIQSFEQGIDDFIENSFVYDLTRADISLYFNKCYFVKDIVKVMEDGFYTIVKYSHEDEDDVVFSTESKEEENETFIPVADLANWGNGLGRYPKQTVKANELIPLSGFETNSLMLSEQELENLVHTSFQSTVEEKKPYCQLIDRFKAVVRRALIQTLEKEFLKK